VPYDQVAVAGPYRLLAGDSVAFVLWERRGGRMWSRPKTWLKALFGLLDVQTRKRLTLW